MNIATAADERYANQALNLIGSIMNNSPNYKNIYVYDLGMTKRQLSRFDGIEGLVVNKVPKFTKYYLQCWSWKIWIFKNCPGDKVLYLDAGNEVLKSVETIEAIIDKNGYFLVSQYETLKKGHTLEDIVPEDYYDIFKIPSSIKKKHVVAAGIIGFSKKSDFSRKVVDSSMKAILKGYNLGWSKDEINRNHGINKLNSPVIRDCKYFRHDQTILNIQLHKTIKKPTIQPISIYGEFRGPNIREDQVIWNSRTNSSMKYVGKIKYKRFSKIRNIINVLSIHNSFLINLKNKIKAIKIKIGKIIK